MDKIRDIEDLLRPHSESVHNFAPSTLSRIRSDLITWYKVNRRRLPWRGDAQDGDDRPIVITPYAVWVSETMCQQTRIATVIDYFLRWMEAFPTISTLAKASDKVGESVCLSPRPQLSHRVHEQDVSRHWAGLGYYRRAKNFHKGAKYVLENYGGELPECREELLKVPGIGPYTAGTSENLVSQDTNTAHVLTAAVPLLYRCDCKYCVREGRASG